MSSPSLNDPFQFDLQLTPAQQVVDALAIRYARDQLAPRVHAWRRSARGDQTLFREMGALGLFGQADGVMPGGEVGAGLIARALEQVDSGYRALWTAQTALVMAPLREYGSAAQCARYLPLLANGAAIGCFALFDQDAAAPVRATRHGDTYRLSGVKTQVTNSPLATLMLVWALDEEEVMRGFLLERAMPGLSTPPLRGKVGLRTTSTGMLVLEQVACPVDNLLPAAVGVSAPLACLQSARYGIAWGALGAAGACWQAAHDYASSERRFGRLLVDDPQIKVSLDEMQFELALALQGMLRFAQQREQGSGKAELLALLKQHACSRALTIARTARSLVGRNGASGVLVERVLANLKVVDGFALRCSGLEDTSL